MKEKNEKLKNEFWLRPAFQNNSTKWKYLKKKTTTTLTKSLTLIFFLLIVSLLFFAGWFDLKFIQTRHLYTMYGIVQLLRWYPGKLPNLEIMFDTDDRPVVRSKDYRKPNSGPPPLFRYCSDWHSLDIVFPDWSFWGWAETNIRPWRSVIKVIKEGNKRTKWKDRVPFAYWKGNPHVSPIRKDLMKCNITDKENFHTLLYVQGFKESDLANQCNHRYKIYVEGWAWSVSEKYILACDSPTLYIKPHYHDFFMRGMIPQQHYWPIRENNKCGSLNFAVQWGNNHTHKAEAIGKAGSDFIHEDMKMEYVFDYIFHLLNEYAKLLKFEPKIPLEAVEICSESLACTSQALTIQWMDISVDTGSLEKSNKVDIFPEVSCSIKCPRVSPMKPEFRSSSESCPEYFRWIHEDLRPWKETGITRKMVEKAREVAHFRVVVVNGRVYFEKYKATFQKRDIVTLWGILQLLSFYPGMLPDLDLVFECGDQPVTQRSDYGKPKNSIPPPLFHYCGNQSSFDIVFPDWSFWGWPELSIRPWEKLEKDLQQSNEMIKWTEREPYAYWKGNAVLGEARRDLMKCNVSGKQDWNARIYGLQWALESTQGYKTSDLATQCTHRYAGNLSERPLFSESIAQEIGKAGSKFVHEELQMKYIYDYMFHLLTEYANLLKYKPTIPRDAVEVCSNTLICSTKGIRKKFRVHSRINNVSSSEPCTMPPSWSPADLQNFIDRKQNLTKQVELWEEAQST
ncbi:hypothetical protein RDI58_002303 [Solanum bulbocastanum]|uniref:Glycosyl transferase CAP10 domain-containing protein n=1 Tax=Solanum bulbocastanum TaxID=147425 RepID=A0AAN8U6K6_SOLBU